ncbi:hypothetical protein [Pseudalkalibacillus sp. SCS-8]|uniref:hypothetical protein n=1 Tax=Pseudalkalibacillus nanhaiensis TaxID=3115291 RepID=UPI0032DA435F
MNSDRLYNEFLRVTKKLNDDLEITPILYGSLGLEKVTGLTFSPQDIDILVPFRYIKPEWTTLEKKMEELGYTLVDLHEHKFLKEQFEIGFSFEEDLWPFAGIDPGQLTEKNDSGTIYRLLSANDYLKVYKRSSEDGYRRTKNNAKDFEKIHVLESIVLHNRERMQ